MLMLVVVVLIKSEMLTGFNSYIEEDVNRVLSVYLLLSEILFCSSDGSVTGSRIETGTCKQKGKIQPLFRLHEGVSCTDLSGEQSSPNFSSAPIPNWRKILQTWVIPDSIF